MVDKITTYVLKGVDPELWKQFKIICIVREVSIKSVMIKFIKSYVKNHKDHLTMK